MNFRNVFHLTWPWVFLTLGLAMMFYAAAASPANAQDWPPRRSCEWRGDCWKYRKHKTPSYYAAPRAEWHPHCREDVDAIGSEHYGADKAKASAEANWMQKVRFHFGVKFMDPVNAKNLRYECSRSSTGERASEKLTGTFQQGVLEQCQVIGQPCRAEKEKEPAQ